MKTRIVELFGFAAALLLAAPAARAQDAFSSFTTQVSGTVAGASEKVSCSGPVRFSVLFQTDPGAEPNAIVTVDTQGLNCVGVSSKTAYLNTGHAILTRVLSDNDATDTSIAIYPDVANGILKARTAVLSLKMAYDTASGGLRHASVKLSSPREQKRK